jgi:tRNA modification GTPase
MHHLDDTIVAPATPPGYGAVAMVRLSGENAVEVAAKIVRRPNALLKAPPRRMFLTEILTDDGSILDRPLCVVYRKPRSYTGENSVEFFLHGSPYIVSKTIELCCQVGARTAEPGEFTLRAFLNGRMDLAQAEAVADLVSASGEYAHRAAALQREGALSKRIRSLRDRLLDLCSLVELEIDFTDQEVPVVDRERTLSELKECLKQLQGLADSFDRGRLAREGARVVIAGAPNVGKSTLYNKLLGMERAIVHAAPGTTRDVIEARAEWSGWTIRLVDSAGLADDFRGPDREAVSRAKTAVRAADAVIWVVDLSADSPVFPPQELKESAVVAGNKMDLVGSEGEDPSLDLRLSALQGEGIDELKSLVLKKLLSNKPGSIAEGVLTRQRHFDAVKRAILSVENAVRVLEADLGDELLAEDLRDTVRMLGEVIGEVTPDDILNKIFADFCIGK